MAQYECAVCGYFYDTKKDGGILPAEQKKFHAYIFEYIPNQYSVTDENLKNVDAVEIKFGQSAKPGMGGHLPGKKVTLEIAQIRGFAEGQDIHSPAHFIDIKTKDDLDVALFANPDFITIDGRVGATAALMACGCQQYRICNTGKCPLGITTQDPELRKRSRIIV